MEENKRRILIVEDDSIIASIYRHKFERAGYEVDVAVDGQAGFYRIYEKQPHAVLLDLMLPQMNGLDILKKIRAQKRFETLPIFVFTNAYLNDSAHEASKAGATLVFNKANTTTQQILDAVNGVLVFQPVQPGVMPNVVSPEQPFWAAPSEITFSTPGLQSERNSFPPQMPPPASTPGSPAPFQSAASSPATSTTYDNSNDEAFQAELRKSFLDGGPEQLTALRKSLQNFNKNADPAARLNDLLELYRRVHNIAGSAAITGFMHIAQMCAALEAFIKELRDKPKNINASSEATLAMAIDFLSDLFQHTATPGMTDLSASRVLVVDDAVISRRAVTFALEKAGLKPVGVDESTAAYNLLVQNTYDLIFLDVEMPGMDGFELCTKLRSLPTNKTTPVVFVTALTDFASRAKATSVGGNDMIAKPFLFMELAVKALTFLLRAQLGQTKT